MEQEYHLRRSTCSSPVFSTPETFCPAPPGRPCKSPPEHGCPGLAGTHQCLCRQRLCHRQRPRRCLFRFREHVYFFSCSPATFWKHARASVPENHWARPDAESGPPASDGAGSKTLWRQAISVQGSIFWLNPEKPLLLMGSSLLEGRSDVSEAPPPTGEPIPLAKSWATPS